jgi:adenylate cyclase
LEPAVGRAERQRSHLKSPANLDAWDHCQRGWWHVYRYTKSDFDLAREFFGRAIVQDSGFAQPHAGMAFVGVLETYLGWSSDPRKTVSEITQAAHAAVALDDLDAMAHTMLCYGSTLAGNYETGFDEGRRAVALNPSSVMAHQSLGLAHMFDGQSKQAIDSRLRAVRISPNDSWLGGTMSTLSSAYYMARDYEKALEMARLAIARSPKFPLAHRGLTNALAQLGRINEAKTSLATFMELSPGYTGEVARHSGIFRAGADFEHYVEGLRKAGWRG